jgi:hypothetical protein
MATGARGIASQEEAGEIVTMLTGDPPDLLADYVSVSSIARGLTMVTNG